MTTIGVTGGVGAGKSEVLKQLQETLSCRILFTDTIANDLKLKGQPGYAPILALLGEEVLDEEAQIDRKKMAAKVFADPALLKQVNGILHPLVEEEVRRIIEEERTCGEIEYLFIEAALLIEAGYGRIVDEMWVVSADEAVRRDRLRKSRGYTDDKIDEILKSQLSEEDFRAAADFILDNSGTMEETLRQVQSHLQSSEVRGSVT